MSDSNEEFIDAVLAGEVEKVKEMIEGGVDATTAVDDSGDSALFLAIRRNKDEVAVELIKAGCDVNQRRKGFGPPLVAFCAGFRKVKQLELLLENGADANAVDEENSTPL
eukprot:TRINITY_DN1868_c3_g4_i2.p2 TRINITY_DN1868_c3_g4~~TRINITY_DN1868_c3_g4_i2.p2  ORF type:complete len:118 (-),score=37.75 TRINITY_DN1868_c3_g4_i2:353-682(-)